ncbi:MAG TPA: cytochrome P450 [Methylomirabilota bacterium]|nr:cytochrome P450 [Methylomirabilota bacterium]
MATDEALFNPLTPEFHADPYPFYRRMRETDPVHLSPLGLWVLTRYDDCVTSLRDPRFGRDGFEAILAAQYGEESETGRLPRSMLFRDPPDHTRLRALVNRAFTPRVIEGMRGQIQGVVDRLLDRVERRGHMDVIADLAYPLPVTVICDMLGVPEGDHEQMKEWSSDIIRSLDAIGIPSDDSVVERGRVGRRGIAEYFRALLPERRRQPRADLLSSLIAVEEQDDRLTEGELLATCVLLFIAGHETTVNLIGNGLLALLRHPGELERLRAEPGLIGSAVEELLRFDSPVQRTARITNAEVVVGGKTLPAGAFVVTAIGAANRDPRHFPDPDRLDIGRTENRHIAFGFGIHFCLGAPLARVEGQLALGALMRRMPKLRLGGADLEWRESSTLRGLKALPVDF